MGNKFKVGRVYLAACLGMMFFGVAFIVMGSVLPNMIEKFQFTETQSSTLVTALPVGVLLASILFGPIVDRYGYKQLMIISTAVLGLGLLGLSFFTDYYYLCCTVFFIGLGGGSLNGETNALVAEIYEGSTQVSKLSILGVCYGVGALAVPFILSVFSAMYSYEVILRCTAIIVLLTIIYFSITQFPKPKHEQGLSIKQVTQMIKQPALLFFSFILFFQSGLEGLLNNWSTSYLVNDHIPENKALLALTALVLGITLMRLLLSYLSRVLKPQQVLQLGLVLVVTGLLLFNYLSGVYVSIISLFVIGTGLAGVYPVVIAKIGSSFQEMSGTAIGIALVVALSGNSVLNYLMRFFAIESFPVFLIVCVLIQAVILFSGRKFFD